MSKDTAIEWCDSSCNPLMGCEGCELWHPERGGTCYAAAWVDRYKGSKGYPDNFGQPQWFPGRAEQAADWSDLTGEKRPDKPWLNGRPRHIFNVDMGDLFSKQIAFEDILTHAWEPMMSIPGRRHVWLVLTKRPRRAVEYEEWQRWTRAIVRPRNVMLMVSITDQNSVKRLDPLAKLDPAIPIGASIEPLLGPVNLFPALSQFDRDPPLDWVIVGGESGPDRRPMQPDWVRLIRDQCQQWGIPFFYKQRVTSKGKDHVPEIDGRQWVEMPNIGASPLGPRPYMGKHGWCQEVAT